MTYIVTNLYTSETESYEGSQDEVRDRLLIAHPWLATRFGFHVHLDLLLDALQAHQAYVVRRAAYDGTPAVMKSIGAYLGVDTAYLAAAKAVRLLYGLEVPRPVYRAKVNAGLQPLAAAAMAAGVTEPDLDGLAALSALQAMRKSATTFDTVKPALPTGQAVADDVGAACSAGTISTVDLHGVHVDGVLLARSPHAKWLLKPGHGDQIQTGLDDSAAGQAAREAAYYGAACALGLGDIVVETHLLYLDSKPYAAIRLLPPQYRDGNAVAKDDPGLPHRLFGGLYRATGDLHKWAALDFVLGNTDRNAGNVMLTEDGKVKLIDHGSSMAGVDFDPQTPTTYVPWYLRIASPGWNQIHDPDTRAKALPRVSKQVEGELRSWLTSRDPEALEAAIRSYGIDPAPMMARLRRLQEHAGVMAADLAVNRAWT